MEKIEKVMKRIQDYVYDPTNPIGKGQYGTVFKGTKLNTDPPEEVAIKQISMVKLDDESKRQTLMTEIKLLAKIRVEHSLRLIEVTRTATNVYLIMEYCNGGSLDTLMKEVIPVEEALIIIKQIASVFYQTQNSDDVELKSLGPGFLHRDLKPANILFHNGKVKVADFGFAKLIDEMENPGGCKQTMLGTLYYMSPQVLIGDPYGPKCDVWATGVMLYQMIAGCKPWVGQSPYHMYMNIQKIPLDVSKCKVNSQILDLLKGMLKYEESERLSWNEIYNHPAIGKISGFKNERSNSKTQQEKTTHHSEISVQKKDEKTIDKEQIKDDSRNYEVTVRQSAEKPWYKRLFGW